MEKKLRGPKSISPKYKLLYEDALRDVEFVRNFAMGVGNLSTVDDTDFARGCKAAAELIVKEINNRFFLNPFER